MARINSPVRMIRRAAYAARWHLWYCGGQNMCRMPMFTPAVVPVTSFNALLTDSPVCMAPWLVTKPACPYTTVAFEREYSTPVEASIELFDELFPSRVTHTPASTFSAGVMR